MLLTYEEKKRSLAILKRNFYFFLNNKKNDFVEDIFSPLIN